MKASVPLCTGRGREKLVILDHVISFPPVICPVTALVQVCKEVRVSEAVHAGRSREHACVSLHPLLQAGAQVFVDGAHALGALPDLDVPALGADYYTGVPLCCPPRNDCLGPALLHTAVAMPVAGARARAANLHKWCCNPKAAAFLWVAPVNQARVLPPVVSHGYRCGFRAEFLCFACIRPTRMRQPRRYCNVPMQYNDSIMDQTPHKAKICEQLLSVVAFPGFYHGAGWVAAHPMAWTVNSQERAPYSVSGKRGHVLKSQVWVQPQGE